MANDAPDIAAYRQAIEDMLLSGEVLEALIPSILDDKTIGNSHRLAPHAIAITSHRLIAYRHRIWRGDWEEWFTESVPFSKIDDLQLSIMKLLKRGGTSYSLSIWLAPQYGGYSRHIDLALSDVSSAREAHDRILAHMLAV